MASPQTENGYTKIANELLRAIYRTNFKKKELSVVLLIARMSYGWSARKTKKMGVREMARELDAPPTSVHLAVQVLIENQVLVCDEFGRYSINKDYESWLSTVPRAGQKVSHGRDSVSHGRDSVSHGRDKTVPRAGQSTDEPKERKKLKESIKGNGDTNTDYFIPTLGEVVAYAVELGKPMDCLRFFDHYSANGWTRGKSRIADWKAVVRLWEDNGSPEPERPQLPRCRCGRDGHYQTTESLVAKKTKVCNGCRDFEEIEAGLL